MNNWKKLTWFVIVFSFFPQFCHGAIWKVSGKVGLTIFDAQMNDQGEITTVLLRIENHSQTESLVMDENFVQLTDSDKNYLRPILADEVISVKLEELYKHIPQHAKDIDEQRQTIQADFPQEKIIKVYGLLKTYFKNGKPIQWRTKLENFLLGTKASTQKDYKIAQAIIEEIGQLSDNYFWSGSIPPNGSKTGMLFFKKTVKLPALLYLQSGDQFLGMPFKIVSSKELP